ncbi:MAG: AmmeMemoRadiSam system radical SAM enzyme [Candidatus Glassbacteria bacterium RIFCSPLOWO2_12_FULL_58_11]|uniref:AmmeMemoRadiSam system radical SAM enzyme n=1 Tax=Candidatus Glassbacteria bacterium RIFCSPLOWO2_12_FULL_58_11 TaxID=1817867 RepID=A0A1F5YUF4_9BACT|nr:MAG: AmmeMemoRadiSam system radical SAM enzyme [Candidatus Glassbacteria bacterium RIFCSPLOWO2_12_FULL_58_11]
MREASYYTPLEGGAVECGLCPHHCKIAAGKRGICAVRENRQGRLISLVYGKLAASHIDPIEKKPLFHFLPGSRTYSVATVGCNLSCPFCQNHDLSLAVRRMPQPSGFEARPESVAAEAVASNCRSLCFTYSEPTIFFEYMLDMARPAREQGLKTVIVSNGFIEEEPLKELGPLLDAANIDLKAFSEQTYRRILKASLQPVLDTIAALCAQGVWTEVTTLIVPGMNDSEQELRQIAVFLASCSRDIPWHVSRFFPNNEWLDAAPTPSETLRMALEVGREAGLRYIYAGNVPGEFSENTLCPSCGKAVLERLGFRVLRRRLSAGGRCLECNAEIAGVFSEN